MSTDKTVAIVLNYNDFENTNDFVGKIQNYEIIDKIIVVDNCSSDNSFEQLSTSKFNGKVDLIRTNKNEGYGIGNNFGIKYAEEKYNPKYIIISNPDIEVAQNTIKHIIEFLKKRPEVSAASGLIHNSSGTIAKNFAWRQPNYWDMILESSFLFKVMLEKIFKYSNRYNIGAIKSPVMKVDVLSGCFFVVKSEPLIEVGYFNINTFLYNEENLLFGELNKNYDQYVLTSEKVIHRQGSSISKNVKKWKMKSQWIIDGGKIYIQDYLKVDKHMLWIFIRFSKLLRYERYISLLVKNRLSNILSNHRRKRANEQT